MEMNEQYWKKFYGTKEIDKPSGFVQFCVAHNFISPNDCIVDIGAGDGRDSFFLNKHCKGVIAVEPNNEIKFVPSCKCNFEEFFESMKVIDIDVVYARWFIHAVSEEVEDKLIEFASINKAMLMLEFRIRGDVPDTTHRRRLIDLESFLQKIIKKGFSIKHLRKGYGMSKVGDNDPLLARVIAECR